MAAKKKKSAPKAAAKEECCPCCGGNELERIESGLLLLIGLIWVLQVLNVFSFGGQYFQIIGSMLVLVIGATKFVAMNTACKC
ncbi:MAG: hypothetical protein WCT52_04975 [Candidatus Micrarchaeia archaeon]